MNIRNQRLKTLMKTVNYANPRTSKLKKISPLFDSSSYIFIRGQYRRNFFSAASRYKKPTGNY